VDADNFANTLVPSSPANTLERRLAHVFVIGGVRSNRMLDKFQMRCDLAVLEQGEADPCPHRQNAFQTAAGDHSEARTFFGPETSCAVRHTDTHLTETDHDLHLKLFGPRSCSRGSAKVTPDNNRIDLSTR
jgi:hypothetical protein